MPMCHANESPDQADDDHMLMDEDERHPQRLMHRICMRNAPYMHGDDDDDVHYRII